MDLLLPGSFFLGLDISTQSVKVTVLDSKLNNIVSEQVQFDSALPHYKTKDGVHRDPQNPRRITSPPQMWIEALEIVFDKLKLAAFPFHKVDALSGSGQQHGSVYWKKGARQKLKGVIHTQPLHLQLRYAFALSSSPVWMDSSTQKQCIAIEEALGGPIKLAELTGSRAYERYTGPQIRKIYEEQPEVFAEVERISLVSSFGASILLGDYAGIDQTDAAGMNLMDFRQCQWSLEAMEATAPELEPLLGPLVAPWDVLGPISPYFIERYGFSQSCQVVAWSGDNPCSLAGLGLKRPGDLGVSLGTSDTVFGVVTTPHPRLEGHVFPNPVGLDSYMTMLVYKNGSLARQDVRDRCAEGSWDTFNSYLETTLPLNNGKLGFFYRDPEILPPMPAGVHRFYASKNEDGIDVMLKQAVAFDAASEVRALVEGQMTSMRAHVELSGMRSPPLCVVATGGASSNPYILQILSNVFGAEVFVAQHPDSASLGAALRAAHGWVCHTKRSFFPFAKLLESGGADSAVKLAKATAPASVDLFTKYGKLAAQRVQLEKELTAGAAEA